MADDPVVLMVRMTEEHSELPAGLGCGARHPRRDGCGRRASPASTSGWRSSGRRFALAQRFVAPAPTWVRRAG